MATGERRLGSSSRRGMTVLGKIPAVPKPINLPSQRLENRGLDPSVEIVPRGTFSWGTGRSPPTSSSSWGNVGLSSSPPINTGAWNTASISAQPVSSSDNVSGSVAQNSPRPLSAGSTRPSSAGTIRPSSASATSGRAWVGAPKLDEQLQPSRFNLATVDFPTLGSEKNPNLRPQQNIAPSNRPTSADATKERNLVHSGTSLNRPTSADGSKERKMVYPGMAPADRPTSADGSLVDKGRHQSDMRLPTFPPFVDGNLSDQRHPVYTGVVGHGTAGPGPGTHGQLKDGHSIYPPLVQHSIALPGSHMLHVGDIMHPGASQHDRYFNGPRAPHNNIQRDVLVLPVDGMYNNYPLDLGSNHFDRSRVHHPQSSWGPNHLDRSGVYQSHRPPPRSSEHLNHSSHGIMQIEPPPYGMETAMQHQQGNRRDGLNATHKNFGGGWDARNVVYIGSSIDAREPSGSGREMQNPDMFTTSWGHEPKHSGWGNNYSGDTSMGTRRGGASSAMYEQTALLPGGPEDRHREGKGAGHTVEILHPVSSKGSDSGKLCVNSSVLPLGVSVTGRASKIPSTGVTENSSSLRQNVQFHKQEDTVKSLMGETMNAGPEFFKKGNDTWVNGSPLSGSGPTAGMQPLKMKQEDERNRVKQSREPQRVGFVPNMANQRQEDNWHGNLQTKDSTHIVDRDGPNGPADASKNTNAKKEIPISQGITKGNKKERSDESEELHCASKIRPSKVSEVNDSTSSSAVLSTSSGKDRNNDVSSGVQVSSDDTKEASAALGSNGALGAVQARSPTHAVSEDASAGNHRAMPTAKSTLPVAPVVETVAVPSSEEEGQALNEDSNTKARRNAHSSRRPHHGRSVHESPSVDKQHSNHGMVWAPVKTSTVGTTKEENQPNTEKVKAGKFRESIQHTPTEINRDKPVQPLQKHQPSESRSQRHAQQVQQMQSAASSHQAQGQQMQEHTVVSKIHHQKVEISSKQQGQRMQQQQSRTSVHKESEHLMQQEQSTASTYKNQTLETKQSVASSYSEQEQLHSQFAASSQREVNAKEILSAKEQQEKAGESGLSPVVDKIDGKKIKSESTIYVPRPARNQQRREQEHDQRFVASHQRFHKKEERSVVEDQENQPSETSTLPVVQSSKNNDEVKSHHSRFSKQQKKYQHESSASLNAGERHMHALNWKKPFLEEKGEQSVNTPVPSCVAEPEDKEENKTRTRKLARHQEMQNKQSAAGSHQEHIHTAGEHQKAFVETPDSNSCESSTVKSEMKLYIPKHRKQKTHQQECTTTGNEGLKSQEHTTEEAHVSNEKDQHYAQRPQLSGVESNVKKDGIELYSPKPARQPHMQEHQSTARGHRKQRIVDLAEGQAVRSSSSQATVESPLNKDKEITTHDGVSDLMEPKDVSGAAGNKDETKLHAVYESSQGKKEVKLYVAKPGRQQHQQSTVNVDQGHVEVPLREGLLPERSHQMPGTQPSKRKEEIKRYTPKPARQQTLTESLVGLEVKPVKETGELSLPEEQEQQRSENDVRANEFEHGYKSRNHLTRPRKSAPFSRPQMKTQPALEDGTVNDHTSRVDETNGAVIFKEHVKDRESGFYQKRGSRQRNHDVTESPTLEEADMVRPKQYQKQHYQYQPVTQQLQTVKPREDDSNAAYEHKLNTRQQDYGQNRYREGPPRRGRHHGYGYRAVDHAG